MARNWNPTSKLQFVPANTPFFGKSDFFKDDIYQNASKFDLKMNMRTEDGYPDCFRRRGYISRGSKRDVADILTSLPLNRMTHCRCKDFRNYPTTIPTITHFCPLQISTHNVLTDLKVFHNGRLLQQGRGYLDKSHHAQDLDLPPN